MLWISALTELEKWEKFMADRKKVTIYTDGACSGNPGPGGWAAILMHGERRMEISGFEADTTNNRMELQAAIEALKCLKMPCDVELFSDSAYLVHGFTYGWVEKWKANGWKNSSKEEVKNIEQWKELDRFGTIHSIKWIKVKGHADNEFNNRCDELATGQIKKRTGVKQ